MPNLITEGESSYTAPIPGVKNEFREFIASAQIRSYGRAYKAYESMSPELKTELLASLDTQKINPEIVQALKENSLSSYIAAAMSEVSEIPEPEKVKRDRRLNEMATLAKDYGISAVAVSESYNRLPSSKAYNKIAPNFFELFSQGGTPATDAKLIS